MSLYTVTEPYSLARWYEYQGAYDQSVGTDLQLELTRWILEADAYMYRGISFPRGDDIFVPAQQTASGSLNVPPFSYLLSITAWSATGGPPAPGGGPGRPFVGDRFTVRVFDKGAQTDLFYGQFGWFPTVAGTLQNSLNMGEGINQQEQDRPFGVYFLRDPLIILPPGVLQVQVINVQTFDTVRNLGSFQFLFGLAVPKNTVSVENRTVLSTTDQTGIAGVRAQ